METPWPGNVKGMVDYVAHTDARETVVDAKTGAKIRINISGIDYDPLMGEPEPFYIESPDGENLYDAYNRKEARMIMSNIRKGREFPDMPGSPKRKSTKKGSKKKASAQMSLRGLK